MASRSLRESEPTSVNVVAVIDKVTPAEMPEILAPYKAIDLNQLDDYLEQLGRRTRERKR